MKILFLGDIVGRSGREAIEQFLPEAKKAYAPDLIIANGENASHGFGLAPRDAIFLQEQRVDVITLGNHAFDRRDLTPYINENSVVIRPLNWARDVPGKGFCELKLKSGKKVLVVNLLGQLFMQPAENPFNVLDSLLKHYELGRNVDAIVVDFHAEATSEKLSMGYAFDGKVSLVVGTHTHVPTNDARVLPKGTAYQTDAGMCGDYNSIIGMDVTSSIARMRGEVPRPKLAPASGPGTLSGILVELDDKGLAKSAKTVRFGASL